MNARRAALVATLALACTRQDARPDGGPVVEIPPPTPKAAQGESIVDAIADGGACTLGHLGPLVDLGDPSGARAIGEPATDWEPIERDGATWARLSGARLSLRFGGPTETPPEGTVGVDLRVRALTAKHVIVSLNGKSLGEVALSRNETRVVSVRGTAALSTGTNEVVLRFTGGAKPEPIAEVDWVHVGAPDEGAAYVAPTHTDALATHTLAGVPRRGYSLRGPGWLRCVAALPERATVEAQLGMLGDGEMDVEARVLRDRTAPLVLGSAHVRAGEAWKSVSWPVALPSRSLGAVELAVTKATPGARALMADVRAVSADPAPQAPADTAKNAVIVVLGSTPARALAPWGGAEPAPRLAALAAEGQLFEAHRAASTWPATSFASILTALPPPAHGVLERTQLPASVLTIADAARQAGVGTALFTANPTTTQDYGFARGFETYLAAMPGSGAGAALFDEAARWLRDHESRRFLLVVHARGAHPPWDASGDAAKRLPPDGYMGPVEAQHAGEILAKARRTPPAVRLTDADRTRAAALQSLAIAEHDAGLGRLLDAIRDAKHDGDTLVIVTSDVGLADHAFLSDGDPLEEPTLAVPLVARGAGFAKGRSAVPTTHVDVGRTVLAGLGLAPPATFGGQDLRAPGARPALAALGAKSALRWQGFVLRADGRREELCDLSLDSACANDATPSSPLALDLLRRAARGSPGAIKSDPAYPSAPIVAALRAWGR